MRTLLILLLLGYANCVEVEEWPEVGIEPATSYEEIAEIIENITEQSEQLMKKDDEMKSEEESSSGEDEEIELSEDEMEEKFEIYQRGAIYDPVNGKRRYDNYQLIRVNPETDDHLDVLQFLDRGKFIPVVK